MSLQWGSDEAKLFSTHWKGITLRKTSSRLFSAHWKVNVWQKRYSLI